MTRWQILCDFDGTICQQDTLGVLLSRFADPVWMAIEREINSGGVSLKDGIARQTDLLRVSQTEFDAALDEQLLDPGFKDFLAEVDRLGLPFTVASSGYDYAISNASSPIMASTTWRSLPGTSSSARTAPSPTPRPTPMPIARWITPPANAA